ncbi:MAG: ATP-binding protein [Chloroflexi bacterium]|nr:ATP-binding protein [Chloroflexota bacterium]
MGNKSVTLGKVPPPLAASMTFNTFKIPTSYRPDHQKALTYAQEAATAFAAYPDGWLAFFGGHGSGKTHLAVAIAGEQIQKGKKVYYFHVADLLDHLRHTFRPDSTIAYDRLFEEVKTADILVLDDLGLEKTTPWAEEKLRQLFGHRYDYRLPTVITTALTVPKVEENKLEGIAPIVSRLRDKSVCHLVNLDAPDYRVSGRVQGRKSPPGRDAQRSRS